MYDEKKGSEVMQLEKPIIQAPMAGVTTPKLVAACSNAGILGSIGAGYLNGQQTRAFIQQVKQLTTKPFQVNLFIQDEPRIDISILQQAKEALLPAYEELGVDPVQRVCATNVFDEQLEAVLDERVPIVSFTFGLPNKDVITRLKEAGVTLIGTATSVAEARAVEEAGCHYVVAQGQQAGGHRGTFLEPLEFHTTRDLIRLMKTHITIPIIAAGGIIDADDIKELEAEGAAYFQVGSAFLITDECDVPAISKQLIMHSSSNNTVMTTAFTGKLARVINNKFVEKMVGQVIAPYPLQHHLTIGIRQKAVEQQHKPSIAILIGERGYLCEETTVAGVLKKLGV